MVQGRPLRALCWLDEPDTRRAVGAILDRAGFHVVGEANSARPALVAAGAYKPHAVVLDLALTGDLGLAAVRTLHGVARDCAVVVMSSFDTMKPAALQAGAYDLVGHSDLRLLERCLQRLAAEVHGALGAISSAATARCGIRSTKAPSS